MLRRPQLRLSASRAKPTTPAGRIPTDEQRVEGRDSEIGGPAYSEAERAHPARR
jgi:hypothetical protein